MNRGAVPAGRRVQHSVFIPSERIGKTARARGGGVGDRAPGRPSLRAQAGAADGGFLPDYAQRGVSRDGARPPHMTQLRAAGALIVQLRDVEWRANVHRIRFLVTKDAQLVTGLDERQIAVWNGPDLVEEFSASLHKGAVSYYQIAYEGPPSPTHLVKVQVYGASGLARTRDSRWRSISHHCGGLVGPPILAASRHSLAGCGKSLSTGGSVCPTGL
jgi:hypothetical protein